MGRGRYQSPQVEAERREQDAFSLLRRLREAAGEELERLLDECLEQLDTQGAIAALRNPHLSPRWIARFLELPKFTSAYGIRKAAVFHPRVPKTLALELVDGLYWADLLSLGVDARVHPAVRRAADERLLEKLPGLSVGEKISIARRASPAVLGALRRDPTPRVVAALLENPRATEALLVALAAADRTSPAVLDVVAGHARWASTYGVRLALCRNPHTPVATSLALLPLLKKPDLVSIAADLALPLPVRRRAYLLAGKQDASGRVRPMPA